MVLDIRTISDDEVPRFREAMFQTFGVDADDDAGGDDRLRALVDLSQAWAVFDGATVVGTAATFELQIGIPGGTLPIAGLTMVTVRPTHRRRGLLRELLRLHLDDARGRGRAASGLWASEASIYGRFGYGLAAEHDAIEIRETRSLRVLAGELDEVEWIDEPRARAVLPDLYARATAERPGALRRSAPWFHHRRFMESRWARGGASMRRHVLARRGDTAVGYVAFRQRGGNHSAPGGNTEIVELLGVDARAEATLWKFVLAMDLFYEVTWWCAPTDLALPLMVDDPRRIARRRADNLWLRIEDVPAALRARRYTSDGVVRLAVEGTAYELAVEAGQARCTPTAAAPELDVDRGALGSLYLGGFTASRLARAGVIRGDARALGVADRLFAWPIAPWCPEVF